MWLILLRRFWPYLAIGAVLAFIGWRIYSAGEAAADARWQPRFEAAERAKAAADARAEAKEQLAKRLSVESDRRYADTIFRLNERAADAQHDIRQLVRLIASTSRQQVPTNPGTTGSPDAAAPIDSSTDSIGDSIAGVGRDCEADSAQLAELQRWVIDQRAALN